MKRDGDRLALKQVQAARDHVDPDEGEREKDHRTGEAADRIVQVSDVVEQPAAEQQHGPQVERDLRHGQAARSQQPLLLAHFEPSVLILERLGFVRPQQF